MCTKEDIKKIDSGKYVIIPKWQDRLKTWIAPSLSVTIIFGLGAWTNNLDGRTFKDSDQKKEVLDFVDRGHPTNEVLVDDFQDHVDDLDIHMTTEEKKAIIIMVENQKAIGGDLAEIKNLLRNNNNK